MTQLPTPVGYYLLVELPSLEDTEKVGKSGLILPEETARREQMAAITGTVVAIGPDAYKNPDRYPSGPWCKPGDFILMRSYSGLRFRIGKKDYRFIPDDVVQAVVADPSILERS